MIKTLPRDAAAPYWARFFERFPTAASYHREHWMTLPDDVASSIALKNIAQLPQWHAWSWYFERVKASNANLENKIKTIDLIIERVGYSPHAGDLWLQYYHCIGGLEAVRDEKVPQKQKELAEALKRTLLHAIAIPTSAVKPLLEEYCQLEHQFSSVLYPPAGQGEKPRNPLKEAKAAVDRARGQAERTMKYYTIKLRILKLLNESLLPVPPDAADAAAAARAAAGRAAAAYPTLSSSYTPLSPDSDAGSPSVAADAVKAESSDPPAGGAAADAAAPTAAPTADGLPPSWLIVEPLAAAVPTTDSSSIFPRRCPAGGPPTMASLESTLRSLQIADALDPAAAPPTRSALSAVGAGGDLRQVALWLLLAEAEESEAVGIHSLTEIVRRVSFIFEAAALCVPFHPHLWAAYIAFRVRYPTAPRARPVVVDGDAVTVAAVAAGAASAAAVGAVSGLVDTPAVAGSSAAQVAQELSVIADRAAKYCPYSLPLALMEASRASDAGNPARALAIFTQRLHLSNPARAAAALGPSGFGVAVGHYLRHLAVVARRPQAEVRAAFRTFSHSIAAGSCGWQAVASYALDVEWLAYGAAATAERVLSLFFAQIKPTVPQLGFALADFALNTRRNAALARAAYAAVATSLRPSDVVCSGVFQRWATLEARAGSSATVRNVLQLQASMMSGAVAEETALALASTLAGGVDGVAALNANSALLRAGRSVAPSALADLARAYAVGHGASCLSLLDAAGDHIIANDVALLPHILASDNPAAAAATAAAVGGINALAFRPPREIRAAIAAASAIRPHTNPRVAAVGRPPLPVSIAALDAAGRHFVPDVNPAPPLPTDDQDADLVQQYASRAVRQDEALVVKELPDGAAIEQLMKSPPRVPNHDAILPNRMLDMWVALRGPWSRSARAC